MEEYPFTEDPIDLFRNRNYRVEAIISDENGLVIKVFTVLDTGAGPNLVNDAWITQPWINNVVRTYLPRLRAAGNEHMKVDKVINLDVQLGYLCVKVWFGFVKNLVEEVLL